MIVSFRRYWQRMRSRLLLALIVVCSCFWLLGTPAAFAGINDDKFDGNIFALYAGNGSLVPPRVPLADALERHNPALLVFYVDDSSDSKKFSVVVSRLQAFYGRAADIIPIDVDAIAPKSSYAPNEPGYYYQGFVPQTVVIDGNGKVAFNAKGNVAFEQIDDVLRQIYNLAPRTESTKLKQRSFNEFNSELSR